MIDGTLEIIKKYENRITTIVSESDSGIYEGLNKGIASATGDVIGFLHSDDLFEHKNVIAIIAKRFQIDETDSIYGDLVYVKKEDPTRIIRYWKSGPFGLGKLKSGWMPPHPTFYVKRKIYEQYGTFDKSYRIAADYDTILRFLGKAGITTQYIPEVLVRMRIGGESNRSISNIILKTLEDMRAMKHNNISNLGGLIAKNLRKVPQFVLRRVKSKLTHTH